MYPLPSLSLIHSWLLCIMEEWKKKRKKEGWIFLIHCITPFSKTLIFNQGWFQHPWNIWQCLEILLFSQDSLSQHRILWLKMLIVLRLRNPALSFCLVTQHSSLSRSWFHGHWISSFFTASLTLTDVLFWFVHISFSFNKIAFLCILVYLWRTKCHFLGA